MELSNIQKEIKEKEKQMEFLKRDIQDLYFKEKLELRKQFSNIIGCCYIRDLQYQIIAIKVIDVKNDSTLLVSYITYGRYYSDVSLNFVNIKQTYIDIKEFIQYSPISNDLFKTHFQKAQELLDKIVNVYN